MSDSDDSESIDSDDTVTEEEEEEEEEEAGILVPENVAHSETAGESSSNQPPACASKRKYELPESSDEEDLEDEEDLYGKAAAKTNEDDSNDDDDGMGESLQKRQRLVTPGKDSTEHPLLREPYERQLRGGKGVAAMNLFVRKFAVNLIERESRAALKEVAGQYKDEGNFEEYRNLHTQTMSEEIVDKLRKAVRSTKLPASYHPCEDHDFNEMDKVNKERLQDIQQTKNTIDKTKEQQTVLQEEYRKKVSKYQQLKRQLEEGEDEGRRESHPLLTTSALPKSSIPESQSTARKFRYAPKGTMAQLLDKIMEDS